MLLLDDLLSEALLLALPRHLFVTLCLKSLRLFNTFRDLNTLTSRVAGWFSVCVFDMQRFELRLSSGAFFFLLLPALSTRSEFWITSLTLCRSFFT